MRVHSCFGESFFAFHLIYGVGNSQPGNFIAQVVKVNVQDGTTQIWQSPNCYPGEPVFVAAPDASSEDEGVILSSQPVITSFRENGRVT